MSSTINIGIICPNIIGNKINEALKQFPSFVPTFKISDDIYDAPEYARILTDQVDVLFFSGYSPYKVAKDKMDFVIPAHYIPLTGNGLYRSLYLLKSRTNLKCLSIDTLTKRDITKVFHELGEPVDGIASFNSHSFGLRQKMIEFHCEKYEQNLTNGAITGIKKVAEALSARGIPNEWVIPTYDDIVVSLERALLSSEKRKSKESQIVVGLMKVDDFHKIEGKAAPESQWQKMKLDINRMLLEYVERLEGHLTNLGGDEFLFVTTRGIFERETRGYKTIPILQDTKLATGVTLSIGVGFGNSANEAGTHARIALRQSKDFGGNICFIVRENRNVVGPVTWEDPLVYNLSVTDSALLEKAEKSGMTATYMSKLMAQVERLDKMNYTAQELASILGITIRSTHRILLQWLDAELVKVVGEERHTSKGRPRQIYRLVFIEDQGYKDSY